MFETGRVQRTPILTYTLAVHIPIAGMSLIPVIFGWPLVLLPIHIAFLHLIIDPACTVVFEAEPEESNVMTRPPRNPKEPLFSLRTLRLAFLQGMSALGVLVGVFAIAYYRGNGEFDARALTFIPILQIPATDKALRMESLPVKEAMTSDVIS